MHFTPLHLHVVKLSWEGYTTMEIAARLNKSDSWVRNILSSPQAAEIVKRLETRVLDTTAQVQTVLQSIAPLALSRKIDLMLNGSEAVSNRASQEILELAGHVATRQIEIRRADHIEEEYRNKTEAEIRAEILESLTAPPREEENKSPAPQLLH